MKPIRNRRDYKQAVTRIYELIQKELSVNSAEHNELEVLSILVDAYEQNNFPIDLPNPIEAIKFRMEQMEYDFAKLSQVLGSKSHVSEILNGKRKLSLSMIRTLNKELKIPAESLIKAY